MDHPWAPWGVGVVLWSEVHPSPPLGAVGVTGAGQAGPQEGQVQIEPLAASMGVGVPPGEVGDLGWEAAGIQEVVAVSLKAEAVHEGDGERRHLGGEIVEAPTCSNGEFRNLFHTFILHLFSTW